jgi:hypothetical protein
VAEDVEKHTQAEEKIRIWIENVEHKIQNFLQKNPERMKELEKTVVSHDCYVRNILSKYRYSTDF